MEQEATRILIVEDDERTAAKYIRALEETGECRTAERVDQVFRQIIDFEPQIILLDIKLEGERVFLPEEAGIRILEQIKQLRPPFREIPVIIITAFEDAEIEERCRKLGAVNYYKKPVPLGVLRQAVAETLGNQASRQQVKVFISSPMRGMEADRLVARQAVQDLGPEYVAGMAEDWTARPEPPVQIWQRAAKECDIFVLLLGAEYGTPSPLTGVSPTEDEYNQAHAAGKPVLVFVRAGREKQRPPELVAFLTRLFDPTTGHLARTYRSPTQLRAEVQRAVRAVRAEREPATHTARPAPATKPSSQISSTGSESTSILFLAADPTDDARLRLGEELREIQDMLQHGRQRERFTLHQRLSARPGDISQAILDVTPQIVHFSGHGTEAGELCFEDERGGTLPIKPEALASLFEVLGGKVQCVVLNACYSEAQARAIAEHVDLVVGMNQEVGDPAAVAFSVGFYQGLAAGCSIEEAFQLGCVQIRLRNIPEHLTPVLIKKESHTHAHSLAR